jgi:hypothetical protein
MKIQILTVGFALCFVFGFSQRPDQYWIGGFEQYPNVQGYADYTIRFDPSGAVSIDTLDWGIPFESTAAAISDSLGKLVLATNGCVIVDGSGNIVPGGETLNPGPLHDEVCGITGYVAPKGAMFLPMPGHPDTYILLHSGARYDPFHGVIYGPLYYSKVVLSNGSATVVESNHQLLTGNLEPFCAVRHGNGRDWWIVQPVFETNRYQLFLLTPNGFSGPWTYDQGVALTGRHIGSATFAPNGAHFARFNPDQGAVVLDFDRCGGLFSNPRFVPTPVHFIPGGGVAFSPSGEKLLTTSQSTLYEADLSSLAPAFDTVFYLFDNWKWGTTMQYFQYSPDHRLFVSSQSRTKYFNEITFGAPPGVDKIVFKSIQLPVYTARSLPNNPNFQLLDLSGSVCDTLGINTPVSATDEADNPCLALIKIAPNPTTDVFYLPDTGCMVAHIQLYDLTGRLSREFKASDGARYQVGFLPAGFYVVKLLTSTGQVVSRPLVIQRGQ